MNRTEHINWAKKRAIEYAEKGDLTNAYTSFLSDLQEHPDTTNHPAVLLFTMMFMSGNIDSKEKMTKFINDFA